MISALALALALTVPPPDKNLDEATASKRNAAELNKADAEQQRIVRSTPGSAKLAAAFYRCLERPSTPSATWRMCGEILLDGEDALLRVTWARVSANWSQKDAGDMKAEQEAWQAYKEKSCLIYANGERGWNGRDIDFPACRAQVVAARIAELVRRQVEEDAR
jgi:uncharacterized protein YecT (DUF1311 family)